MYSQYALLRSYSKPNTAASSLSANPWSMMVSLIRWMVVTRSSKSLSSSTTQRVPNVSSLTSKRVLVDLPLTLSRSRSSVSRFWKNDDSTGLNTMPALCVLRRSMRALSVSSAVMTEKNRSRLGALIFVRPNSVLNSPKFHLFITPL